MVLRVHFDVAKIIHNESFKDKNSSIEMSCPVVWFRRVHLLVHVLKNFQKFTGKYLFWSLFCC